MKLAIVYNFAPKYRTAIFKLIDKEFDCDWYFGFNESDIKGMDTDVLKSVTFIKNKKIGKTHLYIQEDIEKYIGVKKYDGILLLGEPFNISSWRIMINARLGKQRQKIFIWTHGWYGREGFAKKWLKRIYFGLADHVFTYGDYAKETAGLQGFDTSKITAIHNSLDYHKQLEIRRKITPSSIFKEYFNNENANIVFIGRLTNNKRLDMLLNAAVILKNKGVNVNISLIGDGEAAGALRKLAEKNDIGNNIWFYGACYDETKNAELIYNSDLCVSPGNVGLTAVHTLMFGTPVITHNNYPMQGPEFEAIISDQTGDFFEYGNTEDLASKIHNWLMKHKANREIVRLACYNEIDTKWTPEFQINVLKSAIS